jgi:hypothetical protein
LKQQFTGADFALVDQAGERDRVAAAILFKSHDLLSGMHRLIMLVDHHVDDLGIRADGFGRDRYDFVDELTLLGVREPCGYVRLNEWQGDFSFSYCYFRRAIRSLSPAAPSV